MKWQSTFAASAALACTLTLTSAPEAQERTRPDTTRAEAQQDEPAPMRQQMQQMRQMMPMMADMMRLMMQNTMAALADTAVARDLARFTRNYYEALIERGFTRDEALRIVTSIGFPSMPGL